MICEYHSINAQKPVLIHKPKCKANKCKCVDVELVCQACLDILAGKAIKAERIAAGLTRQDIADMAGLTISAVIKVENGTRVWKGLAEERMWMALGMSKSALEKI